MSAEIPARPSAEHTADEHADHAESDQLLPNRPASPSDAVLDDLDAEPADARAPSPPTPATSGFAPPRYSIALDGASGRPGSSSGPIDGEVGQFTHDVDALFNHIDSLRGNTSEKLPTYNEAVTAPSTAVRFGETVVSSSAAGVAVNSNPFVNSYERHSPYEEEVFIEGWPVGNWVIFVLNAVASMAFDFIGFVLTFFLATSHAAREGARAGLGLTLVRYGLYVHDHASDLGQNPMQRWQEELEDQVEREAKKKTDGVVILDQNNGTVVASVNSSCSTNSTLEMNSTMSINSTTMGWMNGTKMHSGGMMSMDGGRGGSLRLFARTGDSEAQFNSMIGIALMAIGWVLLFKSIFDFMKYQRMERLALNRTSGTTSGGLENWLAGIGVWPGNNRQPEARDEPPEEEHREGAERRSEDVEVPVEGQVSIGDDGRERPRWWLRQEV